MIAFSNDTLSKQPALQDGDKILCPQCGKEHVVHSGKGKTDGLVLFYRCGDASYLAGVANRSVMGIPGEGEATPPAQIISARDKILKFGHYHPCLNGEFCGGTGTTYCGDPNCKYSGGTSLVFRRYEKRFCKICLAHKE